MKTKQEIYVPIRNEAELQQAKEILLRNGEKIDENLFELDTDECLNYLSFHVFCNDWFIGVKGKNTAIPLSELESVLKGERAGKQSSIEWLVKELYRKFGENYELTNIVKQAKQMHREEIEQAFENGYNSEDQKLTPYKYYNDTFGN